MIGAISAGVNVLTGIAKGLIARGAHKRFAKTLGGLKMELPSGISEGEAILQDQAGRGLAGKEIIAGNIEAGTASNIDALREASTSPTALLDAITKSNTVQTTALANLDVTDAQTKDRNSTMLASFLGTVKAPAEARVNQFEIDKKIAIAKEQMMATKELLGGVESGIGAGFASFGKGLELSALMKENKINFLGQSTGK